MTEAERKPDFVFEVSWEVANMVGGIHTVLASKARTMRERFGDDYLCIGPRVSHETGGESVFTRDDDMFPGLGALLQPLGLAVVTGRWNIPGEPRALLIDFAEIYKHKNAVLEWMWLNYKVDSITGGWDYLEPVLFGYAVGQVLEVLAKGYLLPNKRRLVALWHEWMVGSGLLYIKHQAPEIASVFVTHATVLGRAICGTGCNLEQAIRESSPEALARRHNVFSKYSLESTTAREADAFATVSAITAEECTRVLGRTPDVLVPNGIGDDYPPGVNRDPDQVFMARDYLLHLAERMAGRKLSMKQTRLVLSAGRYEYVNKGLNLAIDAMAQVRGRLKDAGLQAIFMVTYPTAVSGPDRELLQAVREDVELRKRLVTTHWPQEREKDPILGHLERDGFRNDADDTVIVINCPIYLDGRDPVVPQNFYELMPAFDLSLYASAYEPWGYTPLESLAYGVPTVSSDLAGFGRWVQSLGDVDPAVCRVLHREGVPYEQSRDQMAEHIAHSLSLDVSTRNKLRRDCREVARQAGWRHFIENYLQAFRVALDVRAQRQPGAGTSITVTGLRRPQVAAPAREPEPDKRGPRMHMFTVKTQLPPTLAPLSELTTNLWWSWNPEAEALFRNLDPMLWEEEQHSPIRFLESLPQRALDRAAADTAYLAAIERVRQSFSRYMAEREEACRTPRIAYFCMEYGLHESIPFYSGGLGVLAGDYLKAASDAALPVVGVGLAYRRGYFKQTLDAHGNQHEELKSIDFSALPMQPVMGEDGQRLTIYVRFPGRAISVQAWRIQAGAVQLLLLDSDHPGNHTAEREITAVLYAGDRERRLQQEMVLGIGGSKLLRALGIEPAVYHMNESHTAFLSLDRQFELLRDGELDFDTAFEYCRQTSVFTTHTPIPAGHETYSEDLLRPYLSHYQSRLHQPWEKLMALGRADGQSQGEFSMSLMALRNSASANGVSKIHRRVSQRMFAGLLPEFHESEIPVGSVTNGAHVQTWLAPQWQARFDEMFGQDWRRPEFDVARWDKLGDIADSEVRSVRRTLRNELLDEVVRRLHIAGRLRGESFEQASLLRQAFAEDALVVGFARRFVPYKRPMLVFKDMRSFEALMRNSQRPIVFLFAGKAHPADTEGKRLIREIWQLSQREDLRGSVVFLEDYDLRMARRLVRGCDVWLNNPLRPLEASGTSGMKAGMNGCLNLSILDGWWAEGYHGDNGFSIDGVSWYDGREVRQETRIIDQAVQSDEADCDRIHWLLRHEILPRYFGGDARPGDDWIQFVKHSMISTLREFSAQRMVQEYHDLHYAPAFKRADLFARDGFRHSRQVVQRDFRIAKAWPQVRFLAGDVGHLASGPVYLGDKVPIIARLRHPGLSVDDLAVELVTAAQDVSGHEHDPIVMRLTCTETEGEDTSTWRGEYQPMRTGPRSYGVRVLPRRAEARGGIDLALGLVHWA
jgi:phosphorylase/glycogen(starch) synthase